MLVRVERSNRVLTVVHSRPEARNAVDPEHAQALYEAFLAFDRDDTAAVAVFWGEGGAFCAGADLKRVATRDNKATRAQLDFPKQGGPIPRPLAPGTFEAGHCRDRRPGGCRRNGAGPLGRLPGHGAGCLHGRLLPATGYSAGRWRHGTSAADCGARPGARDHHDGAQSRRRGVPAHRPLRESRAAWRSEKSRRRNGAGHSAISTSLRAPTGARSTCSRACPCARRSSGNGVIASALSSWKGRRAPPVLPRAPDDMVILRDYEDAMRILWAGNRPGLESRTHSR